MRPSDDWWIFMERPETLDRLDTEAVHGAPVPATRRHRAVAMLLKFLRRACVTDRGPTPERGTSPS